jgi:integrase
VPRFPRLPSDGTYGTDFHVLAEFEAMRAMLPQPWDTWVTLGYWTAMRRSDLHRARWGWFDLKRPFVNHEGKEIAPGRWRRVSTKTERPGRKSDVWLPMDPPLWNWLSKLGPREDSAYVTGCWHRANRGMAKACWQAEVPPLSPNGFRRSAVFRWYVEGRTDEWIRVALGHVGYGHREVAASLDNIHRSGGLTRPTVRSRHYYAADPIAGAPRVSPKRVEPDSEERERRLYEKFRELVRAELGDREAAE